MVPQSHHTSYSAVGPSGSGASYSCDLLPQVHHQRVPPLAPHPATSSPSSALCLRRRSHKRHRTIETIDSDHGSPTDETVRHIKLFNPYKPERGELEAIYLVGQSQQIISPTYLYKQSVLVCRTSDPRTRRPRHYPSLLVP